METQEKGTILIVDDVELNRKMLSLILSDNYNILEADNGITAKNVLKKTKGQISLILLDIVMPVMDGFTFLKYLQTEILYHDIPVIFVTSETYEENVMEGLEMGVRDVIAKPYNPDLVRHRVDNLIKLAQTEQGGAPAVISEEPAASPPRTVLIVDDVGINRVIIANALKQDYDILEADNGVAALELLEAHNREIAVVLLDIIMPVMDGFEMMRQAKLRKLVGRIPVLAITSEDSLVKLNRIMELGICEVIQKPFTPAVVKNRVDHVVKLAQHKK